MPPKPRPHGKPRHPGPPRGGTDRKLLMLLGAAGLALVVVVAVGAVVAFGGGSTSAAVAFDKASCTLLEKPALRGVHSITTPTGTSPLWNTNPPTSGPHYEIPAVWGAYSEPVNMAQLVHNLEHGGIYILYGPRVPASTVAERAEVVLRRPHTRHDPRALALARKQDRARRLDDEGCERPHERDGAPREMHGVRPGCLRRVLRRVPVPRPGALPRGHALTRSQLEA
jgi:hypothetical protein